MEPEQNAELVDRAREVARKTLNLGLLKVSLLVGIAYPTTQLGGGTSRKVDAGEVYILYGGTLDCNGNGIPDYLDILSGFSQDCNHNQVPDECDIASGFSEDCDGNEIPDECQVLFFSEASPRLGPVGAGVPQSYTLIEPPRAWETVTMTFQAIGDLGALAEWVDVDINTVPTGRVFMEGANDCPSRPDVARLKVSGAAYNTAVRHGDAVITMVASAAVNPGLCPDSFIRVKLEYQAITADDCNANGVPDLCDILSGHSPDANGNGVPDECEVGDLNCDGKVDFDDIDPFVLALTNKAAYIAKYPKCLWLNGDCNGDGTVDFDDIDPFVGLLTP